MVQEGGACTASPCPKHHGRAHAQNAPPPGHRSPQALGLPERATLDDLATATRHFCARPWAATLADLGSSSEGASDSAGDAAAAELHHRWCFGGVLVHALLADVFGVPGERRIAFANVLRQQDGREVGVDWALGAVVTLALQEGWGGSEAAGTSGSAAAPFALPRLGRRAAFAAAVACSAAGLGLLAVAVLGMWGVPALFKVPSLSGGSGWAPALPKATSRVSIRVT